jgi:hypothetical protein
MPTNSPAEQSLIPKIREAVVASVERTSLRNVARQIRMTPSGLMKFLSGAAPYRPTRRKLEAWFVRHSADAGDKDGVTSPETAAAAIRILGLYASPAERGAFVDALLEQVSPVLPAAPEWKEAFGVLRGYMSAGDIDFEAVRDPGED